jgi:ClpP class serine protease
MNGELNPDSSMDVLRSAPAETETIEVADERLNQPATRKLKKTPAFQAMHAARYRRQEIILEIEAKTGRQLICYVGGLQTEVGREDALFMVDLLHNVRPNEDLDFVLHTPGGDIDAAEKLISMVRNKVGTKTLRVVVPDFAKSAGTLIALGADLVVMSDSSELGPIDPQIVVADAHGNKIMTPIQSYLEAFSKYSLDLHKNPEDPVAQLMLNKMDPTQVRHFETVVGRARNIAEDQLRKGMFRAKSGNVTSIAATLLDTKRWLSHGQMISAYDAIDIGLSIENMSVESDEWQLYWKLHCHQRLDLMEKNKLFESGSVSLAYEAQN